MTTAFPETPGESGPGVLCSTWARNQSLDPIGTAGCYRGYLLIEWPLPWPRDLGEEPALAEVAEAVRGQGMRLQGLVPLSAGGPSRVAAYRWPEHGGPAFERAELVVEPEEVSAAALAVLDEQTRRDEVVDVLVCTHGRRDRCCGSLGTVLAQELSLDVGGLGDGVRVWRTSHTGGHRFAPTAVVLPQGTAWAFCDPAALGQIVRQEGHPDDVLARYRGCAGLSSSRVQALERAVLAELGWPLFEMARWGTDIDQERTELTVKHPGGAQTIWEATVTLGEVIPMPDCGMPPELATKTEAQLVVGELRKR